MAALRNMRREHFAREYMKTRHASKAYCKAYNRPSLDATARTNAWRLLTYADINKRLYELEQAAMKRADITIDKILNDYQRALEMAERLEKPAEMKGAAEAQAKLVGLLRERVETGNAGDFDDLDIAQILEKVAQEAGIDAANALAKAFNVQVSEDKALLDADTPTDSVN